MSNSENDCTSAQRAIIKNLLNLDDTKANIAVIFERLDTVNSRLDHADISIDELKKSVIPIVEIKNTVDNIDKLLNDKHENKKNTKEAMIDIAKTASFYLVAAYILSKLGLKLPEVVLLLSKFF